MASQTSRKRAGSNLVNTRLGPVQPCPLQQQAQPQVQVQQAQQFAAPRLEIVRALADQNPAASVRVGLWDHAWDAGNGALLNGAPGAPSFIDDDARPFFIRVFDDHAAANGLGVAVQWWTRRTDAQNNNQVEDDDHPLVSSVILERVQNTGEYHSPALMLVTDDEDAAQPTHTGVQGGMVVAPGVVGHRLRRVTVSARYGLEGQVRAVYAHNSPGHQSPLEADVPVFAQGERHRIRVTFVRVLHQANGNCTTTNQELDAYEARLQAIYGRCGIFAEVNRIDLDPPQLCTGWAGRIDGGEDPAVVVASQERSQNPIQIVPHPTQTALIGAVRQLPNQHATTIYVFFVANIYDMLRGDGYHAGGEAFYPSQATPPGNPAGAVADLDRQIRAARLAEELFVLAGANPLQANRLETILNNARQAAVNAGDSMVLQANAFWAHVEGVRVRQQTPQAVKLLLAQAQATAVNVAYPHHTLAQTMTDAHRCAFVVQQQYLGNDFAPAHEVTHITTDLNNDADGHFDLGDPADDHPGHIDGRNLMHRYALNDGPGGVAPAGVELPKRLWDRVFTSAHRNNMQIPAQISAILANNAVIDNY